jgi:hypothetical protein
METKMTESVDRAVFFPDTNLFIQCRTLDELDWSLVSEASVIELLVSRPVQAEIDRQKGKGAGRLGKRARAAMALFRRALYLSSERLQVRDGTPTVFLQVRQNLRRDPNLSELLDYSERDDQLVGIAAAFARDNPDVSVRLLTHDNGLLFSAKSVGLPYIAIPEAWLLAPETDEQDKALAALQGQLARYQRAEPTFELQANGNALDPPITIDYYTPLSEHEVRELMIAAQRAHPIAEDFGSREPAQRGGVGAGLLASLTREVFEPATDEEIARYRNEQYPEWVSSCEAALRDLHTTLNRCIAWPRIRVTLANAGSRPAEDAYIQFKTQGRLLLSVPRDDDEEDAGKQALAQPPLPRTPAVPCGQWTRMPTVSDHIAALGRSVAFDTRPILSRDFARLTEMPKPRDPNAFYYKPHRPSYPMPVIGYECSQWRHQVSPETFDFEVTTDLVEQTVSGAITVEIHAANVTTPVEKTLPIRFAVQAHSSLDQARSLIAAL